MFRNARRNILPELRMFRSPLWIIPQPGGDIAVSLGVVPPGSGIIPISLRMAPDPGGMVRSSGRETRERTGAVAEWI